MEVGRSSRLIPTKYKQFTISKKTVCFFAYLTIIIHSNCLLLNETGYFCTVIIEEEKMKRFYGLLLCVCYLSLQAQSDIPRWVDNARKSVLAIETYDVNGNVKKGNGFFIQSTGEAISDYTLFQGAVRAVVTDVDGNTMHVNHIIGADDVYDVIRFKVTVQRSVPFLSVASEIPDKDAEAYLLPAKDPVQKGTIEEITKIQDVHAYYRIGIPLTFSQLSLPLLTSAGEVFALTQADASGRNKTYGISIPYIQALRFASVDFIGKTYSSIGIRSGWSENQDDAQVALFFYSSQQDIPTYLETLNDFIETFPNLADGYLSRASHYVHHRKELAASQAEQLRLMSLALDDLNKYLILNTKEDAGLFNQAKLIYESLLLDSTIESDDWNIQIASEKLQRAISLDDLPVYRHLEGDIAFLQGDFEKAHDSYMKVNRSSFATSLSFYLAVQTRQMLPGANPFELIAWMDSAVDRSKTIPSEAAAYLQESIDLKLQFGQYEAAIKDYDQLYRVVSGNVSDVFYYYREQAKFHSGDLDGALIDIETAIALDPQNAVYFAEEASVYLRMQDPVKAQESVKKSLSLDAEFAAGHRLLGVCLVRQQKKDEACKSFQRAKELGDPVVDRLIEENCR